MDQQARSGFRLTPEQRAQVRGGFDADALERLLAALPPSAREPVFSHFRRTRPGEPASLLYQFEDPKLQALLDEVWAPRWRAIPEEELAAHDRRISQRKLPITLALTSSMDETDAVAIVIRRQGPQGTIILLKEDGINGARLDAAMGALLRDEKASPSVRDTERRVTVRGEPGRPSISASADTRSELSYREGQVQSLLQAPKRMVRGFGEMQSIEYRRIPEGTPEIPGRVGKRR